MQAFDTVHSSGIDPLLYREYGAILGVKYPTTQVPGYAKDWADATAVCLVTAHFHISEPLNDKKAFYILLKTKGFIHIIKHTVQHVSLVYNTLDSIRKEPRTRTLFRYSQYCASKK